jgi:hypothetical protein
MLSAILMLFSFASCNNNGNQAVSEDIATSNANSQNIDSTSEGVDDDSFPLVEKEDDEYISREQKLGIVAEGMLGAAGDMVLTYNGYLGYGYNVLESAYFNHKDVKTSHPILNMDKLAEDNYVYINKETNRSVTATHTVSSSVKEYLQKFNASASISAEFGFVGSIHASFGIGYDTQMLSTQRLITTQAVLETQNDYIISSNAKLLANYATDAFKEDAKNLTAQQLIDKYGTHVLTNIDMGGRFNLNYYYTQSQTNKTVDINQSVEAAYKYVSGDESSSVKEQKKEVVANSTFKTRTYGGSLDVDPMDIDAAKASYQKWVKGVENGNVAFVNASEVYSLWEIIELLNIEGAAEKSKQVKAAFDSKVNEIMGKFKNTKNVVEYISELYIGYGEKAWEAQNMLYNYDVPKENIVWVDLNNNAGGYWIYLGYKTTTDKSKAITGIVADYWQSKKTGDITYNDIKYTNLKVDLNKGVTGRYIYLYYTKDTKAGAPITTIKYQLNGKFQYGDASGFKSVICTTTGNAMDFNYKADGDYVYLWFKRAS